ncbi:ATP-binding protein [Lactobacillus sp. LL6]|uniref:ATP-binding protein n=2 Tax=unclassified Lactobacillus TaxID=2620435 RepID=UPI0011861A60|nr:ATP-binding protein [Lactobacillus sp. LL6]TSO26667.1 ATP-binding protein [Lactobacillus sp. LL6]
MIIQRPRYMEFLEKFKNNEQIKIITGIRRSGKTYIMKMFIDKLKKDDGVDSSNIIQMNFESFAFRKIKDADSLYQYVMDHKGSGKQYLFFDEIQHVNAWQEAINAFRVDLDCDIYVTGSNSSLLSGDLATLLAGRYVEMHVFPLSFSEYYNYHQGKSDTAYQLFLNYVQDGGFPLVSIATDAEVKASIKEGIIDSVILNDVLLRSRLRDETALLRLVGYLMGEVGNSISVSKIVSTLKSNQINVSNPTINTYLDLLKRAFVFYSAKNYDLRGRKYLSANEKYYVVDTGLRNTFINKSGRDSLGHQLEDIVYIELLRRGYQVDVGKYGSKEIDFVARKGDETVYYQVTQQLPENSKRETDNLRYIPDGYKKKVLTLNLLDQGTVDGIEVEYVIDWLLKN